MEKWILKKKFCNDHKTLRKFFSTSEYEQLIPLFPFSELGIQILYLVGKQKENVWHGSVDVYESGYVRGRMKERLRKALNSDPIFLSQEKFCGSQLSEGSPHAQSNEIPKSKGRPSKAVTARAAGKRARDARRSPLSLYSSGSIISLRLWLLLTDGCLGGRRGTPGQPVGALYLKAILNLTLAPPFKRSSSRLN